MNDRVGADLQFERSGTHRENSAIGFRLYLLDRIHGRPLPVGVMGGKKTEPQSGHSKCEKLQPWALRHSPCLPTQNAFRDKSSNDRQYIEERSLAKATLPNTLGKEAANQGRFQPRFLPTCRTAKAPPPTRSARGRASRTGTPIPQGPSAAPTEGPPSQAPLAKLRSHHHIENTRLDFGRDVQR